MSAPASRMRVNAPKGLRPSLEFRPLGDLHLDDSYQRSIDIGPSQKLVRKIAVNWDWGLCQPLIVAKRDDGSLWVVDGQHRLAAARLRPDIYDLPCVVVQSTAASDEAAMFVALNQQRRPLTALDLFRASLEAGDTESEAIMSAMRSTGFSLATTTNYDSLKPGQIVNIGGVQKCYRRHGEVVLRDALTIAAAAFGGQALRYLGTIFPGIVAAVDAMPAAPDARADEREFVADVLGGGQPGGVGRRHKEGTRTGARHQHHGRGRERHRIGDRRSARRIAG